MEKKVIIEEIQMYADQPPFGMDDKIKELHYGDHPLARSVLGTEASVGALSASSMRNYFESRYSPENIFVAAAGRVDFEALVEQVEQQCGAWESQGAARDVPAAQSSSGFHCVHRPTVTQQYVLQLADAPASESSDRYAAKILATMFGDDSGSRLYWEFIDSGLCESASLGHYEYLGVGMFFTWISCDPGSAQGVFSRLNELQQEAEEKGFSEETCGRLRAR